MLDPFRWLPAAFGKMTIESAEAESALGLSSMRYIHRQLNLSGTGHETSF